MKSFSPSLEIRNKDRPAFYLEEKLAFVDCFLAQLWEAGREKQEETPSPAEWDAHQNIPASPHLLCYDEASTWSGMLQLSYVKYE